MKDTLPLVSIGMPVYNEAAHLEETLCSLRAQDYPNIEIVICDNASTDSTLAICRKHASEDSRIRIEPAKTNQGATANFRKAFDVSRGDYFMWAAGHDLWSTGLVSELVSALESNPDACIAFGSSRWIGPSGDASEKQSGWTDTRGLGALARFFTVLWGNMHPVMGLMRRDRLAECGPLPGIVGSDLYLLSALALKGHFVHAAGSTWTRREPRVELGFKAKLRRHTSEECGVTESWLDRRLPLLSLPLKLCGLLLGSELPRLDRLVALMALLPSLLLRFMVGRRDQET